jgi:hypothetical protein
MTGADLKNQVMSGNPDKGYTNWWQFNQQSYDAYKDRLNEIYKQYQEANPESPNVRLERLTPEQIGELDKKLKDPNYTLDLGGGS